MRHTLILCVTVLLCAAGAAWMLRYDYRTPGDYGQALRCDRWTGACQLGRFDRVTGYWVAR